VYLYVVVFSCRCKEHLLHVSWSAAHVQVVLLSRMLSYLLALSGAVLQMVDCWLGSQHICLGGYAVHALGSADKQGDGAALLLAHLL
jgi:hypothetical protein